MLNNQLGERLQSGEIAIGIASIFPAVGIVEIMAPGYDWLWIDHQHGQHTYETVANCCRAADLIGVPAVIRVPADDSGVLCTYADLDPQGIMVPMVNSAEHADAVISGLSFPPRGHRSFGGRRVGDRHGRFYPETVSPVSVLQIETRAAVEAAADIAAVDGVDVLFFGGDDIRLSYGKRMDASYADDAELRHAFESTARSATDAGKVAGCVAGAPDLAKRAADAGYTMLAAGGDMSFLRAAADHRQTLLTAAGAAPA